MLDEPTLVAPPPPPPPRPVPPPPDSRIGAGMVLALAALALAAAGIALAYFLTHRNDNPAPTTIVITTSPATTGTTAPQTTAAAGPVAVPYLVGLGKALDGGLSWPLPASMAGELAQALIAQQVIYQLVKKTSPIKALEWLRASPTAPAALSS